MLAEDFLTPVMAGLGFRDALAFLGRLLPFWIDRGHRLEAALAGAYAKFAASKDLDPGDAGMRAPFLSIAQPFPPRADDGRKIWHPLLLLNATSVESGRRFVFSALAPRYWPSQDPRESVNWLTDSYDFHEVVDVDHDQRQRDASLATAAHNSARFPIVSPAGDLYPHWRDRANRGRLFGHLDDGGYFDNFGAITAHDLAVALGQEGLRPFIILITNDPSSAPTQPFAPTGAKGGSWAGAAPPQPDLTGQTWWRFSSSLETVLATRSAHGDYGVQTLRRLIDPAVNDGNLRPQTATCFNADGGSEKRAEPCFAQLAVYPEIEGDGTPAQKTTSGGVAGRVRDISMSWWASKLVQEYLDEQIISHENTSTDSTQKRQSTNKDIEFAECRNRQAYYTICRAMFPSETNGARECIRSIDAQTNLLPDQRRDCD
jgi:hypothetical protein